MEIVTNVQLTGWGTVKILLMIRVAGSFFDHRCKIGSYIEEWKKYLVFGIIRIPIMNRGADSFSEHGGNGVVKMAVVSLVVGCR